jgi:hypothetical protein
MIHPRGTVTQRFRDLNQPIAAAGFDPLQANRRSLGSARDDKKQLYVASYQFPVVWKRVKVNS